MQLPLMLGRLRAPTAFPLFHFEVGETHVHLSSQLLKLVEGRLDLGFVVRRQVDSGEPLLRGSLYGRCRSTDYALPLLIFG